MSLTLPRYIAHRGASAVAPENTLAAFRKAAELGATWVEFDAMLTADAFAVVHHDDDLKRMHDRGATVACCLPSSTSRRP